jgi:hypothetical protein
MPFCLEGLRGLLLSFSFEGTRGKGKVEPPTYLPLQPAQPPLPYNALLLLPSPSVSVSVSSPRRLKEAGLALLLKTRTVARPPCSWDGKWTFLDTWWNEEVGECD